MKIRNITRKLETINATDINYDVTRTQWGWFIRMTARIGGYYDFEATDQLTDREHSLSETQAVSWFKNSEVYTFETKPYHDESDPRSDYCAWSFHRKIKDLDWKVEAAANRVPARHI